MKMFLKKLIIRWKYFVTPWIEFNFSKQARQVMKFWNIFFILLRELVKKVKDPSKLIVRRNSKRDEVFQNGWYHKTI